MRIHLFQQLFSAPWFKPFRNAGVLALGRVAQAVLALATIALATRALGVEMFGVLVFVHALAVTIAHLARFQIWQAILRYGAQALEMGDTPRLQRLICFALGLEAVAAAAGTVLMIVLAGPLLDLSGMDAGLADMVRLYGLCVPFMVLSSVPLGVLRLYERHDLLSWQSVIMPAIRFAGVLALFWAGAGVAGFIALWFASVIIARSVQGGMALSVLKAKGGLAGFRISWPAADNREEGLWRFALGTQLASSLNITTLQLGTLLAGILLGPAAAGIYRLAQQVADILVKPVNKLLVPAISPDMAWMSARRDWSGRAAMVAKSMGLAGALAVAFFLILIFAGEWVLTLIGGAGFAPAYPVLLALAGAGVVQAATFPLEPMLTGAGHMRAVVTSRAAAFLVYISGIGVLTDRFDVLGAGLAAVLYAFVTALLAGVFALRLFRAARS